MSTTPNNTAVQLYRSGRGNGGTGLGSHGTRRHRGVLRDNIQGITKPAIRRLARRGGVKRISGLIYEETRGILRVFLENVLRDAVTYTEHARRKTVTAMDVVYALKRQGRTLYGFGTPGGPSGVPGKKTTPKAPRLSNDIGSKGILIAPSDAFSEDPKGERMAPHLADSWTQWEHHDNPYMGMGKTPGVLYGSGGAGSVPAATQLPPLGSSLQYRFATLSVLNHIGGATKGYSMPLPLPKGPKERRVFVATYHKPRHVMATYHSGDLVDILIPFYEGLQFRTTANQCKMLNMFNHANTYILRPDTGHDNHSRQLMDYFRQTESLPEDERENLLMLARIFMLWIKSENYGFNINSFVDDSPDMYYESWMCNVFSVCNVSYAANDPQKHTFERKFRYALHEELKSNEGIKGLLPSMTQACENFSKDDRYRITAEKYGTMVDHIKKEAKVSHLTDRARISGGSSRKANQILADDMERFDTLNNTLPLSTQRWLDWSLATSEYDYCEKTYEYARLVDERNDNQLGYEVLGYSPRESDQIDQTFEGVLIRKESENSLLARLVVAVQLFFGVYDAYCFNKNIQTPSRAPFGIGAILEFKAQGQRDNDEFNNRVRTRVKQLAYGIAEMIRGRQPIEPFLFQWLKKQGYPRLSTQSERDISRVYRWYVKAMACALNRGESSLNHLDDIQTLLPFEPKHALYIHHGGVVSLSLNTMLLGLDALRTKPRLRQAFLADLERVVAVYEESRLHIGSNANDQFGFMYQYIGQLNTYRRNVRFFCKENADHTCRLNDYVASNPLLARAREIARASRTVASTECELRRRVVDELPLPPPTIKPFDITRKDQCLN